MRFSLPVHWLQLLAMGIWYQKQIVEGYFVFSFVSWVSSFLTQKFLYYTCFNIFQGIPCFAYMMSAMSDFINNQLLHLRQYIEHSQRVNLPRWFIPSIYIGGGSALLIGAPIFIFIKMEKWTFLQSLYFGNFFLIIKDDKLYVQPLFHYQQLDLEIWFQ